MKRLKSLPAPQPKPGYPAYNFAFLDEGSKREVRRATLKAVAIPGYQVPFASREMPIGRGWGTGGLQITLSLIGPADRVKVIDQGSDDSVNAVSIRDLIEATSGVETTADTAAATIIQSRHRIPEERLRGDQILVLQVPEPEPLRILHAEAEVCRQQHAEMDYSGIWLRLYEDIVRFGEVAIADSYPCLANGRYIFSPSPIPRWDVARLHRSDALFLFGAGRERRIYAIVPYTDVEPLQFDDHPFEPERFPGARCLRCQSADTFVTEVYDAATGAIAYRCSDTNFCDKRLKARDAT